jgi:hypothetical protein
VADVAPEADSFEAHPRESGVGALEGPIEVVGLGHHRQHAAPGRHTAAIGFQTAAGMEELQGVAGLQGAVDGVAPAHLPRVTGGGGNLLCSFDGGKTWFKDKSVGDVPSNFYKVKFLDPEKGFILGQKGTILKYSPAVA